MKTLFFCAAFFTLMMCHGTTNAGHKILQTDVRGLKTKIIEGGVCGAMGRLQMLTNTDPTRAYYVTIRITVQLQTGGFKSTEEVRYIAAGATYNILCSVMITGTGYLTRTVEVVGERAA